MHRYKADIEAADTHLRTPLFIACAMNREQCADYLIQCLDHSVHVVPTPAQTPTNAGEAFVYCAWLSLLAAYLCPQSHYLLCI